jgi:3'(2'), 5'-bisphosphate nucleotidase
VTTHAPDDTRVMDDVRLAGVLATGAATALLRLRAEVDAGRMPYDATSIRRQGDALAQAHLAAALAEARPGDAVLSEEAVDDPRRLEADRVWIIDPLDGTREFAERDPAGTWRDDFAVHVALWQRGPGLTDAAVALPARGQLFDTRPSERASVPPDAGAAAILEGRRPMRITVSRTRPPAIATRLAELGAVELVPMGSCGVKAISVLEGSVDAYLHAGGAHEWDSAAPVAIVRAAGLVATRLDGSEPRFNQPDPWTPDLLVCRPGLLDHLRHLLAGLDRERQTR